MGLLKNPFAVRDGKIILIEDLTSIERGSKCKCQCPACNRNFIARMGDQNKHHFSHKNDACDEVLAYTSGLYKLVKQILDSKIPFYIPGLVVSYNFPRNKLLNENNIEQYTKIIREGTDIKNQVIASSGCNIVFESVELFYNNKYIQALELTYRQSKMAIKIIPPENVSRTKSTMKSAHKSMPTLVIDFTNDMDFIQTSNSEKFQKYILSKNIKKIWVSNPKIKRAYPQIFALNKKEYEEHAKQQKKTEKQFDILQSAHLQEKKFKSLFE